MAQKLPIMIPKPHSLVATGSFGGLSLPNKVRTISVSRVFIKFSERQAALHTRKAPLLMIDDFLATVLDCSS